MNPENFPKLIYRLIYKKVEHWFDARGKHDMKDSEGRNRTFDKLEER